MTRWGIRRRDQAGAVAVEFALVFPLLVMLLIGTVTSGISYSHAIGATNAVREGARFGATTDASLGDWTGDVVARVRGTQFDDPDTETKVCVQLYKQGSGQVHGSCTAGLSMPAANDYPEVPTGLASGVCVVRVLATRPYTINAIFVSWDEEMRRGAVARYERDSC
jgi:Flp pilus assembly protein TadG